ncbi:SDR family NAD(P)-dependent oxidoreductase [Corynebacterium doosanense]|uniref:Short-chain dehydrogenase n=1 Tax=Corynebacterium doosanense CAU 212 = DSM 45436 TaxID=558173 RepID=A0A097IF09_9CORY|nr:SDR family NAD(P)-dependent oxidoreductase [Corynebacterium doosanense]AIT60708.1 short-chain dehydrogenase [Corynebacterium doosanense CAU 212 = DSM 45436]
MARKQQTRIAGSSALVTGASSGIGREICRELARRGVARLVIVARREAELRALATELARPGLEVQVRPVDLADPVAAAALVEDIAADPVDILCLGAGFGDHVLFDRSEWSRIASMVQVNLTSVLQLVHGLLPGMIARRRGALMIISSGSGYTHMPMSTTYATTKHALAGFCANLRLDLTGTPVTVTEVAPGPVPTGFDVAAGAEAGLDSQVPAFMVIDAKRCAIEAVDGLERGEALVWPGRGYRALMRLVGVMPRPIQRAMFARSGSVSARQRI